jgi:hypothetical protein
MVPTARAVNLIQVEGATCLASLYGVGFVALGVKSGINLIPLPAFVCQAIRDVFLHFFAGECHLLGVMHAGSSVSNVFVTSGVVF